jgi:hypothetical protein
MTMQKINSAIDADSKIKVNTNDKESEGFFITDLLVTNGHAANGTWVSIVVEGSGEVIWKGYAAEKGGGFTQSLKTAIPCGVKKKINVVCSAAADVVVCANGITNEQ